MPIDNIHDKYFRGAYLVREVALAHVQHLLDKTISSQIEEDTFYLENISYLDEQLKETYSDIVYSANLKDGKSVKITFLFEPVCRQRQA